MGILAAVLMMIGMSGAGSPAYIAGARAYSIYLTTESIELAQYEGYGFQQRGYEGYFPGAKQRPREGGFPFPGPYYGPGWTYVCGPYGCGYVMSEPYGYPVYPAPDDWEYGYGD